MTATSQESKKVRTKRSLPEDKVKKPRSKSKKIKSELKQTKSTQNFSSSNKTSTSKRRKSNRALMKCLAEETDSNLVTPGQRLGHLDQYTPGKGTYVHRDFIHASLVGYKSETPVDDAKPVLSVVRDKEAHVVPRTGSVVICKVVRVNPRLASVNILCCDDKPLQGTALGIIRVQDVRMTELDKVEIYNSFRPGDIVKAEVLSLGNAKSYFLTTAKNEYGVIFAKSVAGATMVPISWEKMQCPKTNTVELRKVAKSSSSESTS